MSPKLLVFGRTGQVARALAAAPGPFDAVFAGRDRLDLSTASPDIAGLVGAERPAAVVNLAAYNAVDSAERDGEACRRLNAQAPARMAQACLALDIPFVHFSTDYVFDGEKGAPYVEPDARAPVNAYGRAKADGEDALAALAAKGARLAVIRTAWIFAPGGGGFLGAMIKLAAESDEARVVADQWGSPTPAAACAEGALVLVRALLDRDARAEGVFHAAGRDGVSRADFAEAIFRRLPKRPRLTRLASADYPAAAVRPRDTRLSSAGFESAFGWRAPGLDEWLDRTLAELAPP
ncbi:MAG: dTDP-4-dehydrorhamnose reductase [Caulobacteraceae bacterium]